MAAWAAFGAVVGVVLALLLALSWLTGRTMSDGADGAESDSTPAGTAPERAADAVAPAPAVRDPVSVVDREAPRDSPAVATLTAERELSGGVLLANVAASQGTFTVILVVAAVATGIPLDALGMTADALEPGALAAGVGLGLGLAVANQGVAWLFRRLDVAVSEELRALLAPETPGQWAALAFGALPLVAVFEEFLFRSILIGAVATGFGVDPWLLVAVSSGLFAAGHSAQGAAGIVVTGGLGLVLGAAFVITGSFATVVVAHYLVNVLEFLYHER